MQIDIYYKIIDGDLSVREVEDLVRRLQTDKLKNLQRGEKKKKLNNDYKQLSEHLNILFSTEVNFKINEQGKGKIVIAFNTPEEMERILGVFDRLNSYFCTPI